MVYKYTEKWYIKFPTHKTCYNKLRDEIYDLIKKIYIYYLVQSVQLVFYCRNENWDINHIQHSDKLLFVLKKITLSKYIYNIFNTTLFIIKTLNFIFKPI